jgi:hypothetical protein
MDNLNIKPSSASLPCVNNSDQGEIMEILAGLVKLDKKTAIPIPWYNRPALGITSGMTVNVGTVLRTENSKNRNAIPPDIIVSPLDVSKFEKTISVTVDLEEGPGQIGRATQLIRKSFNIELMETVTINHRQLHRICFVISPIRSLEKDFDLDSRKFLDVNFSFPLEINRIGKVVGLNKFTDPTILHRVYSESVVSGSNIDIKDIYGSSLKKLDNPNSKFDFSRVVISSNTEARFIRYIFPLRGSFEITIFHNDVPGAMAAISSALDSLNYNILLSRISKNRVRTPDRAQNAKTILICEPATDNAVKAEDSRTRGLVERNIRGKLKAFEDHEVQDNLPSVFSFSIAHGGVSTGRPAPQTTDIYDPTKVSRKIFAPLHSQRFISAIKSNIRRYSIFISMPSAANSHSEAGTIRRVIESLCQERGIKILNGYGPAGSGSALTPDEIWARIWLADAHIFIADEELWLTRDQQIEWAYAHAICGKRQVITSARALTKNDISFMIPKESAYTYKNLGSEEAALTTRIAALVDGWFDTSHTP